MQEEPGEQKWDYACFDLYQLLRTLDVFIYKLHKSFPASPYNQEILHYEDTLRRTQTNSAKKDGEIAQENYSSSKMFQDLKNQIRIFEPNE